MASADITPSCQSREPSAAPAKPTKDRLQDKHADAMGEFCALCSAEHQELQRACLVRTFHSVKSPLNSSRRYLSVLFGYAIV